MSITHNSNRINLLFCLIPAAPTLTVSLERARQTIKLQELQINQLKSQVADLTQDKLYFQQRLSTGNWVHTFLEICLMGEGECVRRRS